MDGSFSVTSWQVLFLAGLMVGWAWENELSGVGPRLRRAILAGAAATTAVVVFLAMVARDPTDDVLGPAIAKFEGGLLAFVFAGAALVAAYAVLESIARLRWTAMPLRPLQILGTKGLSGFVALVLCVLFLDVNPSLARNDVDAGADPRRVRAGRARHGVLRPMASSIASRPGEPGGTDPGRGCHISGARRGATELKARRWSATDLVRRVRGSSP